MQGKDTSLLISPLKGAKPKAASMPRQGQHAKARSACQGKVSALFCCSFDVRDDTCTNGIAISSRHHSSMVAWYLPCCSGIHYKVSYGMRNDAEGVASSERD